MFELMSLIRSLFELNIQSLRTEPFNECLHGFVFFIQSNSARITGVTKHYQVPFEVLLGYCYLITNKSVGSVVLICKPTKSASAWPHSAPAISRHGGGS